MVQNEDPPMEKKLVKKAQKGDKKAFSQLYDLYLSEIYRFCFYKTGNHQQAEDLTQEIFLKVLKSLNGFKGKSSFKNWLYGIAKHVIIDFYRNNYKLKTVSLNEWNWVQYLVVDEEDGSSGDIKAAKVKKILASLKDNYRKVLELRFLKGYSIKEVAKELGFTESNVKIIQYRAIRHLRGVAIFPPTRWADAVGRKWNLIKQKN